MLRIWSCEGDVLVQLSDLADGTTQEQYDELVQKSTVVFTEEENRIVEEFVMEQCFVEESEAEIQVMIDEGMEVITQTLEEYLLSLKESAGQYLKQE